MTARKRKRRTEPALYPALETSLPSHLQARIQATAQVLGLEPAEVVRQALDRLVAGLSEERIELIDRVAASLVNASEVEPPG